MHHLISCRWGREILLMPGQDISLELANSNTSEPVSGLASVLVMLAQTGSGPTHLRTAQKPGITGLVFGEGLFWDKLGLAPLAPLLHLTALEFR